MTAGEKDPLHGITLERILTDLVARHGWPGLAAFVDVRCFTLDPSIKSSLTFLRRTPWARAKVEALYVRGIPYPAIPANPASAAHPASPGHPAKPASATENARESNEAREAGGTYAGKNHAKE